MARPTRLVRLTLSAAAAALLASCATTMPIQTAEPYAASDGYRVEVAADVRGENIMVLTDSQGGEGQVLGALVNDTYEDITMSLAIADGGVTVPVPARSQVLLGVDELVVIPSVPAAPGSLVDARIEGSGHGSVVRSVPVLDGTLPQYADSVPR